jgi:phytanoyl-CoA hydroxylase
MNITQDDIDFFNENGYFVARGLLSTKEADDVCAHFMQRRAEGPKPGDMGGDKAAGGDPLNKYPRMINMHKWDDLTAKYEQDTRLRSVAEALVGDQVDLNQTMLYFKPPQARGQAMHQDNQYIRHYPIIAAWVALDDCDEANGRMIMIPGSNKLGLLPVQPADQSQSFTNGQSFIPEGSVERGIDMKRGDVLFFGGFTIHGSYPNQTTDRFRRAFIVHYKARHLEKLPEDATTSMASLNAR